MCHTKVQVLDVLFLDIETCRDILSIWKKPANLSERLL